MKTKLTVILLAAAMTSVPCAHSQSFLNKLKDGKKKLEKTVDDVKKAKDNLSGKKSKNNNSTTANNRQSTTHTNQSNNGQHPINTIPGYENVPVGNVDSDLIDKATINSEYPVASNATTITTGTHSVHFSDFVDGVAYVYDTDYGAYYIDRNGNKLFTTDTKVSNTNNMPRFCDGVVMEVPENTRLNTIAIKDKKGNTIKEFKGASYATDFIDGVAMVEYNSGDLLKPTSKVIYVDTRGQEVLPKLHINNSSSTIFGPNIKAYLSPVTEGIRRYSNAKSDKGGNYLWGLADENGNIITEPCFAAIGPFSEGMASALRTIDKDGNPISPAKWSVIDKTGKDIIPARFSNMPSQFQSGLAVVEDNKGKPHYIDKQGKDVFGPTSTQNSLLHLSPFYNGYALMTEYVEGTATISSIIDHNFNKIASAGIYDVTLYQDDEGEYYLVGQQVIQIDPKTMNMKGQRVLENVYNDGMSRLSRIGYLDKAGNIIIKFEKELF